MSQAGIYLQIGQPLEIRFGNPLREVDANLDCFDLDNHSEASLANLIEKAVKEKEEGVVILLQQHSEATLGVLTGFLERLIKSKSPMNTYALGNHHLPPLMVKRLKIIQINSLEELKT